MSDLTGLHEQGSEPNSYVQDKKVLLRELNGPISRCCAICSASDREDRVCPCPRSKHAGESNAFSHSATNQSSQVRGGAHNSNPFTSWYFLFSTPSSQFRPFRFHFLWGPSDCSRELTFCYPITTRATQLCEQCCNRHLTTSHSQNTGQTFLVLWR
jgi:hypothetical protein